MLANGHFLQSSLWEVSRYCMVCWPPTVMFSLTIYFSISIFNFCHQITITLRPQVQKNYTVQSFAALHTYTWKSTTSSSEWNSWYMFFTAAVLKILILQVFMAGRLFGLFQDFRHTHFFHFMDAWSGLSGCWSNTVEDVLCKVWRNWAHSLGRWGEGKGLSPPPLKSTGIYFQHTDVYCYCCCSYVISCHRPFPLETTVIPTTQASRCKLLYFLCYVLMFLVRLSFVVYLLNFFLVWLPNLSLNLLLLFLWPHLLPV